MIKVWDTSRIDKNGVPYCHRITRTIPEARPVNASVLCVQEALQLMAVGFFDGSLLLYRYDSELIPLLMLFDFFFRGDIIRDRNSKRKLLRDSSSAITGLAFKATATSVFLFVATGTAVFVYNVTHKDKEQKVSCVRVSISFLIV